MKSYTYDAYERSCNIHIKPALGRIRLSALTAPQIQQFYNSLITEKELSPKTVKNIHGVLHRALGQAVKLGMLRSNPTNVCDLPKAHRKEIKPMEQAEITKFLQAIQGTKYGLVYQITLFTGLREGEVLGLTWDCIDFQHNAIYINKQLQKTKKVGGTYCLAPTKNSRNRTILTAPSVMALLRKQKSQQAQMFADAEAGDTILVLEVPRLARSTQQLCEIIEIIREKRLRLVILGSITLDCREGKADPMSEAFLQMAGVFSQLELAMIRSRVRSGMANAKAKGKRIGRPQVGKEDIPANFLRHYPAFKSGTLNVSELARVCDLSRTTVYKYIELLER